MSDATISPPTSRCSGCGSDYATRLLACPRCHRLTFAEELKGFAAAAEEAGRAGDLTRALGSWREALALLPPSSRQHDTVQARVIELSRLVDESPAVSSPRPQQAAEPARGAGWGGGAGAAGVGTLAVLLWKFKFLVVLALTKGKLLLLGLTKASTFFSMFLSLGVYWAEFGWWLALGLVLSIYVHEMGHVAALRRFGIQAGAPMFIPGLGAMVRLKQTLPDARADARVGLAGPIWGLGAALVTYGLSLAFGSATLAAITKWAALINLFNLIPIWQLDGSRGFRSMSRPQRWFCALAIAVMWSATSQGLLVALLALAALRAATERGADEPDRTATMQYVFLVVTLSALMMIPVPLPG